MSCPACDEVPKSHATITCDNGHVQCVKCMIGRIRAQYSLVDGITVFNDESKNPQCCFTCRVPIGDDQMPKSYSKLLLMSQNIEMGKKIGLKKDAIREVLKEGFNVYAAYTGRGNISIAELCEEDKNM